MQTLTDRVCTGNDAGITQGLLDPDQICTIKENFQDFGVSNTHAIIEPNKYWLDDRMPCPSEHRQYKSGHNFSSYY